jgi:hypothetical protein
VWRLALFSIILVTGTAFSYVREGLPGQIKTGKFLDTHNNYKGFRFERPISQPHVYRWNARLDTEKAPGWKIVSVWCFRDKALSDQVRHGFAATFGQETDSSMTGSYNCDFPGTYYALVRLEQIEKDLSNPSMEAVSFELFADE